MERARFRFLILSIALLGAVSIVVWRGATEYSPYVQIHVLHVGQGDAIFIELPDTTQILIDGGPDATVLRELSDVMGPFDRFIDVVIATHPDADHIGGLPDVLARYDVGTIVDSGIEKDTLLYRDWIDAIAREGAEIIIADKVKRLTFGDTAFLDILWPQDSYLGMAPGATNEYSIVTKFTYGSVSVLLTGDIERSTEQRLIASGVLEDIDILKVAHHGSKTSTTAALLEAIQPELALISVGERNRYNHPSDLVLSRLAERGIETLRTDLMGRITIESDGERYWLVD